MRTSDLKYTILSLSSTLSMVIILAMPFHAFLTVWLASIFGHYTALRLWKEILLVLLVGGVLFLLATDHKIRSHTLSRLLVQLILLYSALNLVAALVSHASHGVTAKALGYGLIVNLRFLAFFLVTWALAVRLNRLRVHWQWITLWPAVIVVAFGVLQVLFLPNNFLTHFGYNLNTIPAFETINHNSHYIRIASTLRGANPLGAYLLIPISLVTMLILRGKRVRLYGAFLAATLFVEFFSFSRSAWIGAMISLAIALFVTLRSVRARKIAAGGGVAVLVLAGILFLAFHNSTTFQNYTLHTQKNSAVKASSNQGHLDAWKNGAHDVVHEPLGRGVGTAGPASVYNDHPGRIAESYYLQIGQETGWLGLVIFLLINVGVGYLLWLRREHPLALSLFASLIGISFIGLFSHVWTDDTLAYVWWGLAGIAMSPGLNPEE
jgi:hypothetical protein